MALRLEVEMAGLIRDFARSGVRLLRSLLLVNCMFLPVLMLEATTCGGGGDAAPGTGTATVSSSPARLLFRSDFGGTVHVGPPSVNHCSSNNGWWPVLGQDHGFDWPIRVHGASSPGLQVIAEGVNIYFDPKTRTISSCAGAPIWKAEIIQGTRHDGTTGPILHRVNYQTMAWQFPYVITPSADVPDQYQKVWMKLPSNLASTLGPNSWYALAEWKTSSTLNTGENYDYRVAVYIYTDSNGSPYWFMTGTERSEGPYYWTQKSTAPVPLGSWFQFEWAWHRTHDESSWTWVKVDGNKIMQQNGGGKTCSGCHPVAGFYNSSAPIDRIMLGQIYGAKGPTEQWIDELEIWDGVP